MWFNFYRPLEIIFKETLSTGFFSSSLFPFLSDPIHKKGDKQVLKNYHVVSLLPICGKIFERLIFNEMFNFLLENSFVSPSQSGFKPGDSSLISYYPLYINFFNHLIKELKLGASSWIFLKPLIRYCTKY